MTNEQLTPEFLIARINQLCREKNYDCSTLAKNSGVPPTTISNIVNGNTSNPGIFTIAKLCKGFNITLSEFFQIKN